MSRNPAADRGREVRQRLLDAAVELIVQRGWTGVSTRTLAERAGLAAGGVHYHFPSLPALLAEAAIGAMRPLVEQLDLVLRQAKTPEQGLELMLGSLAEYTGMDNTSLLFGETYLAATRDERLRAEMGALVDNAAGKVGAWLATHGVAEPEQTARVLLASIDGLMLHRALNPRLTAQVVAPVLRRVLASAGAQR
ncbi:MAG: TetR/AcrR family transcriptional regulator [Sciscionella sp.]|nr:TetR/AcrR family transcriptional regulator [Sciscionella sp.]